MFRYVTRDLLRNPRRTVASVSGVALAVGLFSGISLFVDSAASQMTARAIAPVVIDMQAGINNPLASPLAVAESVFPASASKSQVVTVTITVVNQETALAHGVIVKDVPPSQISYLPSSTKVGTAAVADVTSGSPLATGLAVGDLHGSANVVLSYQATALADIPIAAALPLAGTVQSTENPTPVPANSQAATDLSGLLASIRAVPGVTGAQLFASADLPAGSLRWGTAVINAPIKIVALDPSYVTTFPLVSITSGSMTSGSGMISPDAANALSFSAGSQVPLQLTLPGGVAPLTVPVSGIADFSQDTQLFLSRNPDNQGEFVGAPYIVAVDTATFKSVVIPALRADAATATPVVKLPPVIEMDVRVSRDLLSTSPSIAAITTAGLRRTIERVAPGQITVTDNLSDALSGARTDAILAKVLFIFLGIPGVLLAAYLSRYAASLLSQAQRRERATLRARGIHPSALLRALAYNTAAIAVVGTIVGLGLSLFVVTVLFGAGSSLNVGLSSYLSAAGLAFAAAIITTAVALFLPGRRALLKEVADERREIDANVKPGWLRVRLDLFFLVGAALIGLVTYLTGGYAPAPAAEAQSISLSFYVLLAPLLLWVGATLLAVRGLIAIANRWGRKSANGNFHHGLVRRTLLLSVLRRPQAVASGVVALSLAIAFGTSLTTFVATYQSEKVADAHYIIGGDVRARVGALPTGAKDLSNQLQVPGVTIVSPLVQSSSIVVGTDKRTLIAIDPKTFNQVAHINPTFLTGATPDQAMAMLLSDPSAVLIDQEVAKTFNIQVGDHVNVQIPSRQTGKKVPFTFKAVASFTKFPGFPQGVDFVGNLATYQTISGNTAPDTYLLATDGSDAANAAVVAAVKAGPGKTTPMLTDTLATALNTEQSTLSALNVSGLGRLEIVYTLLMSGLGITIFVFGLLLQRRKENVTMRALGMRMASLQTLIVGEAGVVTVASLVIGGLTGTAMALMSVQILQPVFTVPPSGLAIPWMTLGLLAGLVSASMLLASLVAGLGLRRAHLVEILREE